MLKTIYFRAVLRIGLALARYALGDGYVLRIMEQDALHRGYEWEVNEDGNAIGPCMVPWNKANV